MDSSEKYSEITEIGAGGFGEIHLVRDTKTKKFFAIKKLKLRKVTCKDDFQVSQNEVRVLSQLKHPHIVTYLESYEENGFLHIVMAFCSGGDLGMKIQEKILLSASFEDREIHRILYQLCSALEYIHSQHIIHRDIKPRNIFLTDEENVKLGDFGLSKVLDSSLDLATSYNKGTFMYTAPEIFNIQPYTSQCDMWSLGCLLYEMATLKVPFPSMILQELIIQICNVQYERPPTSVSSIITDHIDKLIQRDDSKRPTAKDLQGQIPVAEVTTHKEISLLMIGNSASGKSATGNSILRKKAFTSTASATLVTKELQSEVSGFSNRILKVWDCPGRVSWNSKMVVSAIERSVSLNPHGINAILYVVPYKSPHQLVTQDKKVLDFFKAVLGDTFLKNFGILVITCCDHIPAHCANGGVSLEDLCDQAGLGQLFQECDQRCVLFDNNTKEVDRQKAQISELISMVDSISVRGYSYNNFHLSHARQAQIGTHMDTIFDKPS